MADELAGLLGNLDNYSSSKNDSAVKARILSAYDDMPWKTSRRDALSGFMSRFIFIQARRTLPLTLTDEAFIT